MVQTTYNITLFLIFFILEKVNVTVEVSEVSELISTMTSNLGARNFFFKK